MNKPFYIVIPARFASTRFPGKPLVTLCGKAMLAHAYDRALASNATETIIATDDQRIADYCDQHKLPYLLTLAEHESGTDRISEVAMLHSWEDDAVVVGLQCDEPATPPSIINQVAGNLEQNPDADIATLCSRIELKEEYLDTNRVKVVTDNRGFALYFSRAPIPFRRDAASGEDGDFPRSYVHIGMYAYRVSFLRQFQALQPSYYESEEKLEQLRALSNGFRIHVDIAVDVPSHGVDHPDDVAGAELALNRLIRET